MDASADVNMMNDTIGTNALDYATDGGNAKMVKLLIKAGAKVNSFDKFGLTPLILQHFWQRDRE